MIANKTKNKILAKNTKICKNTFSKAKGLMFSKRINDKGLVFVFNKEKKWSIHMLFVFFPIDVLWLNKKMEVVDMRRRLKPFVLNAKPREKSKFIVELPAGSIERSKTSIGDKITFC